MILLSPEGNLIKVYRFHSSTFDPNKMPHLELIQTLSEGIQKEDANPFWDLIGTHAPVLDFK